jgi:aspartate/methionine/tyrosine aminotransferase
VKLPPDRLNAWLNEHHFATPPVRYDLGASTGPVWTLQDLLALDDGNSLERLLASSVSYVHSAGGRELRQAIATMAGVDVDQVRVTTGGAEALWILFLLAATDGANVVVPRRPSFPTFHEAPAALGIETRPYAMPRERDFAVDLAELYPLVDRNTKVIVVNRPHNPTGAVLPDSQLEELHDFAVERRVQLVVDEVMHPIYHTSAPSSASRLPGATVVGDFSKAMCLSGLRLGWIVDRDPQRLAAYEHARSYFTVSSGSINELLGSIAIEHRDAIYGRAQATAERNLAALDEFFHMHADRFEWVRPAGGFTALPWLRSGGSATPLCRAAAAAGVLLAPGECFAAPHHFRIGFGATDDGFAEALDQLDAVVAGLARA